jgi:hypothetical protein
MPSGLLHAPQMILIGSSGRNAGKTVLAEALIRAWKGKFPIAALKITGIAERSALCPRGGAGCGACVNIGTAGFALEEELGLSPDKDTARLLKAGADRVFWLRALYGALQTGYQAFLDAIPPNALILCESNSLREAVRPGCFIMLIDGETMKPTASRVLDLADMVVSNRKTPEDLTQILSRIQAEPDESGAVRIQAKP